MLEIDKYTLQPHYYLGLRFREGYWMVQLLTKQQRTVYKEFAFNSGTAIAVNSTSGWEEPSDTDGRYYMEPQDEDTLYQIFLGLAPSTARMYLAYPEREDRMNLISVRDVPGDIGYWDGEDTPYRDPSPETELWTTHDLYPSMNVENAGITGESTVIRASFWITKYGYRQVTDDKMIRDFMRGDRPCKLVTMGDPDRLIDASGWIKKCNGGKFICPEEVL
jgi:hypothetical protein